VTIALRQSVKSKTLLISAVASLQRRVADAQRQLLMDLRARGVIGDAAFQLAEEELDLLELTADPASKMTWIKAPFD
jgi:hypothetical protein